MSKQTPVTMCLEKIRRNETVLLTADEGLAEMDRIMAANFDVDGMHSPAEFERQLGILSDERLLEETAKFSKAGLDGFETACLVDELCHRLKRRIEA